MQIKRLELKNFARFEELIIDFAPQHDAQGNVTVFIGNNGSGKTALLKSLALSLSWLVARIERERGSGSPISELDISNGTNFSQISLTVEEQGKAFQWALAKTAKGKKSKAESSLTDTTKLADIYRTQFTENNKASFPLIIYYPVERAVLDVPLKIRTKHNFSQLDGYDNSLSQGVDFRRFFEWFRDREDADNENLRIFWSLDDTTIPILNTLTSFEELDAFWEGKRDKQLSVVRKAIFSFMPEFYNLRIERKPRLRMIATKKMIVSPLEVVQLSDGRRGEVFRPEHLDILQLSQGEKSLMALVGDIARRLAMMNPALENPLHGEGVVLIDEVDMHLHPNWQRSIVQNLQKTFPNCQFILTTHSPAVISDSPNLLVYELNDGEVTQLPNLYGMDVNMVLLQEMDTGVRNSQIEQQLNDLFNTIQLRELDSAKEKLIHLEKLLPINNSDLLKARLLLRKMELRHAENQQK